jgi:two-component system sensor histidine kinase PilS (NtrC family)
MQSTFDERSWLAWLGKVRVIILTCLLGIELAVLRLTPSPLPVKPFVTTILLWCALSVFYTLLLSFWQEHRVQSLLQVLTDLAMVTLVVHVTGGVDSSLNFLYPLVIIVACILLPRRWAFLTAALAFILYGTVIELAYYGAIPSYATSHTDLKSLQAIILLNLFGYLGVAYLAGQLAARLRRLDVQLQDTSGALENLQALHENIIQAISGGLITTGLEGHITLVNAAARKLLERSEGELLGEPVSTLFLDPLPPLDAPSGHTEVRCVTRTGMRKTFRVRASTLMVPERGLQGFVYTFDDVTQIRRLEREVRMRDRLTAVGRLSAAIAHEIRNPLTSIAGSVQMLAGIPALSDEHRLLLEIVTRESERLNGIITDFLDYSRGKQYQFEKVDLVPLLEDTLTLLEHRLAAEKTGIQLVRNYGVPQAMVLADGDKMKQVFWNFCENAVRAMSKGGRLTVSLESEGEDWGVNFADTGPGLSPQQVENIFEPFQSQFEGGTGLGLAIVYQIVQAHEGKVWARSNPGQGTTFVLRLRRRGVEAEEVPGTAWNEARPADGRSAPASVAAAAAGRGGHG